MASNARPGTGLDSAAGERLALGRLEEPSREGRTPPVTVSSTSRLMRTGFTAVGSSDGGRLGAYVLGILAVGAAYYLAARAGLALAYLHGSVTALWPPIGVGIAALTVYGARLWPGILIGDLLAGDFSTPFFPVVGQTAGNVLEVVVAALLLRRLVGGRTALDRTRDVAALLVSAAVGTAISALVGTASLRLGGVITPHEFPEVLRTWWLSDTTGALVVAPVFLTWLCTVPRTVPRREAVEGAIVLAVLVALAEIPSQRDVPYVVFPVLIWAALRLGTRGAATAVVVVAGLTVWNTGHNAGPFVRDSITDSLLSTQLFMAIAALTSLVLAAVTAERARAEQRLVERERAQRTLAAEQAALRRIATVVAGDASAAEIFALVTQEVGRVLGAPTASIIRYDDEHTARIVGVWTDMGAPRLPVGSALSLDGDSVIAKVRRSGSPQRLERYEDAVGSLADTLRTLGHRSAGAGPAPGRGEVWGALAATTMRPEPFPDGYEQRLCDFAELVAQAVSNAEAHDQLAASRARIVEAGDAERRRLERNLHDGAQQRLVSLALHLRLITAKLDSDPQLARELLAKVS